MQVTDHVATIIVGEIENGTGGSHPSSARPALRRGRPPEEACRSFHRLSDLIVEYRDEGIPAATVSQALKQQAAKTLGNEAGDSRTAPATALLLGTCSGTIAYAYDHPHEGREQIAAVAYNECVRAGHVARDYYDLSH